MRCPVQATYTGIKRCVPLIKNNFKSAEQGRGLVLKGHKLLQAVSLPVLQDNFWLPVSWTVSKSFASTWDGPGFCFPISVLCIFHEVSGWRAHMLACARVTGCLAVKLLPGLPIHNHYTSNYLIFKTEKIAVFETSASAPNVPKLSTALKQLQMACSNGEIPTNSYLATQFGSSHLVFCFWNVTWSKFNKAGNLTEF